MKNSLAYSHVVQQAEKCGASVHFLDQAVSAVTDADSIENMVRFYIDGRLQLVDQWDTLKPILHEMSHVISWSVLFGRERTKDVFDPVDWFIKNLLSESFANTVELLVFCSDVKNQAQFARVIYRYADMNMIDDMTKIIRTRDPAYVSAALLATFLMSNFKPHSLFLQDEWLENGYALLGVKVDPIDRHVFKSIVVPCKSRERFETQNKYYAHFGYPGFGDSMAKKDFTLTLQSSSDALKSFPQLALIASEILKNAQP